jgi:PAS domain-containing protein
MREQDDILAGKSLLRLRGAYMSLLAVILAAFALGFWWVVYNEDRDLRVQFLEHARMVSRAIDWIDIQELSASEADLASPAYRRIKAQLTGIHNAGPNNRFVYLLKQRPDGVIVILADSEPPSSKDYSPPGKVYQETSATIRHLFASGREATVGPYGNRRGHMVSAIAPVSDPEIGRTVALLGMDIDARDWYRDLVLESAESLSLILLFVVPLAVYVIQRRRSEKSLLHASEEWRRTFDTIPDMISIVDSEHRIVRANRATWQKLGCEMQDLVGKPYG